MTTVRPVSVSDVEEDVWYEGTDREIRGRALSDTFSSAAIGFGVLTLLSGSNTKPAHWHSHEEEHLYVLSGNLTLHLGDEVFLMRPGDYVRFPAGVTLPHWLENCSDDPVSYIMVGPRIDEDRVTHV